MTTSVPKCPRCGTNKHARPNGHRMFYCTKCAGLYDDSGDDGTTGYGDPARIASRNERHTAADKARRNRDTCTVLKEGLS